MFMNSLNCGHKKSKKQEVITCAAGRSIQIDAAIGDQGPVIMLTTSIESGKRLFMEQNLQIVPFRNPRHHVHHKLIVVIGHIDFLK